MSKSSKTTLAEQIYLQLRRDIITQKIPCGEKITLQSLKKQFGVSHTPIRDALTRLDEEGLVTYYSNCGVNVVSFTEQDINELFQFAAELDAMSVEFCRFSFSTSPLLFELDELLVLSDQLLEKGDIETYQGYSEDFHLLFYKHSNNHYLTEASRKVQAKISLLSNLYYSDDNLVKVQKEHHAISDCIHESNYTKAADLMRKHTQDDVVFALKAYKMRFLSSN